MIKQINGSHNGYDFQVFYIELMCDDDELITENIKVRTDVRISAIAYVCHQEVKITSPDYKGIDQDEAVQDFSKRIKNYEAAYEPLDLQFDKYVKLTHEMDSFYIGFKEPQLGQVD